MNRTVDNVLHWLIIGVVGLIVLSVVGVLIDIASALLGIALRVGVVVLFVLLILRFLDRRRR